MTLIIALSIIGGVVLTTLIMLVLLYCDHLVQVDGNDEENYPSEGGDRP